MIKGAAMILHIVTVSETVFVHRKVIVIITHEYHVHVVPMTGSSKWFKDSQ